MFVPRAHVYLGRPTKRGFFSSSARRAAEQKHDVKFREYVRMPCLVPTFVGTLFGFAIICGGGLLCFIGYNPSTFFGESPLNTANFNSSISHMEPKPFSAREFSYLRVLTYIGPVLMGIGFFVFMVALVLYCEIKDKYVTHILPDRDVRKFEKDELYDMIIEEFRKNYFRGIEVPLRKRLKSKPKKQMPTLFKALSISTPALLITPEMHRRWQGRDRYMSVCEATPIHRERARSFHRRDSWLKTSSLPNVRPRSSMREFNRSSRKFKYQNLNKQDLPCDFKQEVITSQTSVVDSSGVDNPAFRESPTEAIRLKQIRLSVAAESPPTSSDKTRTPEVILHENAAISRRRCMQRSSSDARGYTLKRDIDSIDSGEVTHEELTNVVREALKSVNDHSPAVNNERLTLDNRVRGCDVARNSSKHASSDNGVGCCDVARKCATRGTLDNQLRGCEVMRNSSPRVIMDNRVCGCEVSKNSSTLVQSKRPDFKKFKSLHDINAKSKTGRNAKDKGPYKTRIGIYKSESCLDNLGHHYVDMKSNDDSSSDDGVCI